MLGLKAGAGTPPSAPSAAHAWPQLPALRCILCPVIPGTNPACSWHQSRPPCRETWPFFRPNFQNMEAYRQEWGAEEVRAEIQRTHCPPGLDCSGCPDGMKAAFSAGPFSGSPLHSSCLVPHPSLPLQTLPRRW